MWITNKRLRDFLELNGLIPKVDIDSQAFFEDCDKLHKLISSYNIRYNCQPNK